MMDTRTTALEFALEHFALDPDGPHGLRHWSQVCDIGCRLADLEGADKAVVEMFALFHDLCRVGDGVDRGHGRRAAELVRHCRSVLLDLDDRQFGSLWAALAGHDCRESEHEDITVKVCWDAERLTLPRFGITPLPRLLHTESARSPAMIAWAVEQAGVRYEPGTTPAAWTRSPSMESGA
jgi:uncharacterized protein